MHGRRSEVTREGPPVVLVCAGLDPSGGAGILMDAAFVRSAGAHPAGLVTTLTRQSPRGVFGARPVAPREIGSALRTLVRDLPIAAMKVGLFGSAATADHIAEAARSRRIPLVVDPVVASTSGFRFIGRAGIRALRDSLFPAAAIVTPNREEAASLSGRAVESASDAVAAGRILLAWGPHAVLVKGISWRFRRIDVLVRRGETPLFFSSREIAGADPHGTGCALASAIAAYLAAGRPLASAVRRARSLVAAAILRRFAPSPGGLEFLRPPRGKAR